MCIVLCSQSLCSVAQVHALQQQVDAAQTLQVAVAQLEQALTEAADRAAEAAAARDAIEIEMRNAAVQSDALTTSHQTELSEQSQLKAAVELQLTKLRAEHKAQNESLQVLSSGLRTLVATLHPTYEHTLPHLTDTAVLRELRALLMDSSKQKRQSNAADEAELAARFNQQLEQQLATLRSSLQQKEEQLASVTTHEQQLQATIVELQANTEELSVQDEERDQQLELLVTEQAQNESRVARLRKEIANATSERLQLLEEVLLHACGGGAVACGGAGACVNAVAYERCWCVVLVSELLSVAYGVVSCSRYVQLERCRHEEKTAFKNCEIYKAENEQLSEQLARLREVECKLNAENTKLMRLTNPNAKIQYTQKLKQENNELLKQRDQFQGELLKAKRLLKQQSAGCSTSELSLVDKVQQEAESLRVAAAESESQWTELCALVETIPMGDDAESGSGTAASDELACQVAAAVEAESGVSGRAFLMINQMKEHATSRNRQLRDAQSRIFILEKKAILDEERRTSLSGKAIDNDISNTASVIA